MPFIPLPQGVKLCFDFVNDTGQQFQFCLSLQKISGSVTTTDLSNLSGAGSSWWTGTLKALLDDSVTLRQVRATDETTQGGPQDIETVGTAGTASGSSLPMHTALVVSQRTAKRGRAFRGRAYVGGFNGSQLLTTVRATTTHVANLVSAFGTLQTDLGVLGFKIVVANRHLNGAVVNPAQGNEVIAFIVDQAWDSQRRRLEGRGN